MVYVTFIRRTGVQIVYVSWKHATWHVVPAYLTCSKVKFMNAHVKHVLC